MAKFSMAAFLCGASHSHKMKKLHKPTTEEASSASASESESKDATTVLSKLNSNLSHKALSMVKMISWRKVQADEEQEYYRYSDEEDEALWRKNILMGEKCRPLDFSGKIVYDSHGNIIPDHPKPYN